MFKNLNIILEGAIPLDYDKSEIENMKTPVEVPEEITKEFQNLRNFINNLDCSEFENKLMEQCISSRQKETLPIKASNKDMKIVDSKVYDNVEKVNDKPEITKKLSIVPKPGQTLYFCPIDNCDFVTTKEGFKNGKAALHFSKDHKVKLSDMTPGKYKFHKVKGEKAK